MWWMLAAALVTLLCLTRVGVWGAYDREKTLRLSLRVGWLKIRLLPGKKKKTPAKSKKKKESKKPKKKEPDEAAKKKLSFTREDIEDALRTLLPALGRALGRTRRGLRIRPLRLWLALGGQEDPAASAQLRGRIEAAVWGGMPRLERLLDIRDVSIHTEVDFESPAPVIEAEAGLTFRIGTLLALGFGLAVPALRWFLRFRKRAKNRPADPPGEPAKEPPEAA